MLFRKILGLVALLMGIFGAVACAVGSYVVWQLGARLEQVNERTFAAIDKGVTATQDRLRRVQNRIKESKITAGEIKLTVSEWTVSQAKERLAARLEIDRRADKLAGRLETADSWLESSTESLRGVQQILELGSSLGAPIDPAALDDVLGDITSLRTSLQEIEQSVDGVREFVSADEDKPDENRLARTLKLIGRVLVTIVEMDTRLKECETRLTKLQSDAQQLKAKTSHLIWLRTVECIALLAWMAAGQICLCLCGSRICCRNRYSD